MSSYTISGGANQSGERQNTVGEDAYDQNVLKIFQIAIAAIGVLCLISAIVFFAVYSENENVLSDKLDQKESEIAKLESQIEKNYDKIAELGVEIENNEGKTFDETLNEQITELENEAEMLNGQITSLEEEKKTLETDISSLKTTQNGLIAEIENATAENENVKNIYSDIKSEANRLGYYSEKYNSNRGVVFLKKGQTAVVTLYNNENGSNLYSVGDNDIFDCEKLDNEFVNGRMRMKFTGLTEGISYYEQRKENNSSIGYKIVVVVE